MKKFRPFAALFAIVFIVQLYAEYEQNIALISISKPLICLVLMAGLYVSTRLEGKFKKRIFIGLTFAFIGDVLLMFQTAYPSFFMFGLIAFLICHLFYLNAFLLDFKSNPGQKNPYFFWSGAILCAFCGSFYVYLKPDLGGLAVPVLIYSFFLTLMVIFAISRLYKVNLMSFTMVTMGALFFLLSDSMLAYNKFKLPIPNGGVAIMGTYMMAQYLIVSGTITRVLLVRKTEIN